ncbi:MAG: flagellar biosynthesis protein FlhB [candidate division WOR-3 bacterium]
MFERGGSERTEPATPRKREEARRKGEVPRSRELSAAVSLIFILIFFYLLSGYYIDTFKFALIHFLSLMNRSYSLFQILSDFVYITGKLLVPFLLAIFIAAIISNVVQFGFVFTLEPLLPKVERLNPFNFVGIFMSRRTWVELLKAFVKAIIVFYVTYIFVKSEMLNVENYLSLQSSVITSKVFEVLFRLSLNILLLFLLFALLDYGYQRWEYELSLKMTREELKEELRQYEGDPVVRSRMRRLMREISKRRMLREVPKATVVITNPVELAVALKYDEKEMKAPIVVAKGAGEMARRIKDIARKHNVPLFENRPLARALFRVVEVGEEVPPELYKAVAEVLAYVYLKMGKR